MTHIPVMLAEAIEQLKIQPDGVYVDATFGGGGHAREILARLGNNGRLLVIDKDVNAIAAARKLQSVDSRVMVYHGSFAKIGAFCSDAAIEHCDGIVVDLGVSSFQLDNGERGFSFMHDGVLDMRMNQQQGIPAHKWLATAATGKIIQVLREYGQERFAAKIAAAIVEVRAETPITTTKQLSDLIVKTCGNYASGKHPATRTFQALRILVNSELDDLTCALPCMLKLLRAGGRIVVISFHSGEDSIVKQFVSNAASRNDLPKNLPINNDNYKPLLQKIVSCKASKKEVSLNPRARSARLRVAEKCV